MEVSMFVKLALAMSLLIGLSGCLQTMGAIGAGMGGAYQPTYQAPLNCMSMTFGWGSTLNCY